MKSSSKTKPGKCLHCRRKFSVNPRQGKRHRYCDRTECRQVAKQASQRRWLSKPENTGYFKGSGNALRVRLWRAANPKKRTPTERIVQRLTIPRLSAALRACGVQDLNERQLALVLGVVSTLARSRVQEVIARRLRRLMFAGYAVLRAAESPSPASRRPDLGTHPA